MVPRVASLVGWARRIAPRRSRAWALGLVLAGAPAAAQDAPPTPPPTDPPPIRIGSTTILGYVQLDGLFATDDQTGEFTDTFRIRRARVGMTGDLGSLVSYTFNVDMLSTPILRDAFAVVKLAPQVQVKIGQYYVPFGLERLTSTQRLEVIDRSMVSDRIGYTIRDLGVTVLNPKPWRGWLSYQAGVFNGAGQNTRDNNDAKDVIGRVVLTAPWLRGVALGLNGAHGRQPAFDRNRAGGDVTLERGAWKIVAEAARESLEQPGASRWGYYVLGAWRHRPRTPSPTFQALELAIRLATLDDPTGVRAAAPGRTAIPRRVHELQGGANYYVNRNVRLSFNTLAPLDDRTSPGPTLLSRLQIAF